MSAKHLSVASFFFTGITTLSAQTPIAAFKTAGVENNSSLGSLVGQLTQSAVMVLLSIAIVIGIAWLFYIWKACADLNKKNQNTHKASFSTLLCIVVSLSILGSACTATQQAQASDIRAAQEAEGGYWVRHAPFYTCQNHDNSKLFNQYAVRYNSISKAFCRHCGMRIYRSNH